VTEKRQFHNFIIITVIVPSAHDSVVPRESASGAPNASDPEEKKTLERQIKTQDELINRYQADLTKRGG
jgi:hypothetical protein